MRDTNIILSRRWRSRLSPTDNE